MNWKFWIVMSLLVVAAMLLAACLRRFRSATLA